MRILIVDDDFITRKSLVKMLQAYGDCDEATNGRKLWLPSIWPGRKADHMTLFSWTL